MDLMKLGRDEVAIVPDKCFSGLFFQGRVQDDDKIGQGVFFRPKVGSNNQNASFRRSHFRLF